MPDDSGNIEIGDFEITVIIPACNRFPELQKALQSVLSQTLLPAEVIIVDDGSDPGVLEALQTMMDESPVVIRVLRHEKNQGAAAARNTGIRAANYDYIAFLDSDDIWHESKLEVHSDFILTNNSKVSCTAALLNYANSKMTVSKNPEPVRSVKQLVWGCDLSPGSTLIFHKSILELAGFQDENLRRFEDWDWMLKIVGATKQMISVCPTVLATIHIDDGPPNYAATGAIDMIRHKFRDRFLQEGRISWLKFLSTLEVEKASWFLKTGLTARAFQHVFLAILIWPFRNKAFWLGCFRQLFIVGRKMIKSITG